MEKKQLREEITKQKRQEGSEINNSRLNFQQPFPSSLATSAGSGCPLETILRAETFSSDPLDLLSTLPKYRQTEHWRRDSTCVCSSVGAFSTSAPSLKRHRYPGHTQELQSILSGSWSGTFIVLSWVGWVSGGYPYTGSCVSISAVEPWVTPEVSEPKMNDLVDFRATFF